MIQRVSKIYIAPTVTSWTGGCIDEAGYAGVTAIHLAVDRVSLRYRPRKRERTDFSSFTAASSSPASSQTPSQAVHRSSFSVL